MVCRVSLSIGLLILVLVFGFKPKVSENVLVWNSVFALYVSGIVSLWVFNERLKMGIADKLIYILNVGLNFGLAIWGTIVLLAY